MTHPSPLIVTSLPTTSLGLTPLLINNLIQLLSQLTKLGWHRLLAHRLNNHLTSTGTPMHLQIHTLTVHSLEIKEVVNPQSDTTLRQAPGHEELYEHGQRPKDLLKSNSAHVLFAEAGGGGLNIML